MADMAKVKPRDMAAALKAVSATHKQNRERIREHGTVHTAASAERDARLNAAAKLQGRI